MKHYPVGIDLDGVTVDFMGAVLATINREYPHAIPLRVEEITEWEFLPKTPFGTWGHFWRMVRLHDLFRAAHPYPRAIEAIKFINSMVGVAFITARPQWAIESTQDWLDTWGLYEYPVFYNGSKGQIECSAYVDDSPEHLFDLVSTKRVPVFRMVRPWNRPVEGVIDIDRWDSLIALRIVNAAQEASHEA